MINLEQMGLVLAALPDPAFVFSRSGKYIGVFGGRDTRYYHDGTGLVGLYISDLIKAEQANWFLQQIELALESRNLRIVEYELSNKDVKGLADEGPKEAIWFEGRIQSLDFLVAGEEVVLWVASNISERYTLERRLRELSETDQLTGLFNRRKLEYDLRSHYESYVRHAVPTSLCMFDLDNLKKINDTQGHHAGDEIIQAVAHVCLTELQEKGTACRFGGDEFVVTLPHMGREESVQWAEHLRDCIKQGLSRFTVGTIRVTASLGVTTMMPDDASYEDALRRVDHALYEAKGLGKDRIVVA